MIDKKPTVWLTSARRGSAVFTGAPMSGLLADGPARVRRQESAHLATPARIELPAAVNRGYVPVAEGAPVFTTITTIATVCEQRQTKQHDNPFANGGLRGSHPWRDPVKT